MNKTEIDNPSSDFRLEISRIISASAEKLFDAWITPELLVKWWGPKNVICPSASIDLKVGGKYKIANQFEDGSILWIYGIFDQIIRPEKLVYTWNLNEGQDGPELVTVSFSPKGKSTKVTIIHERISSLEIYQSHTAGWQGCLDSLALQIKAPIN